jgi:hypothetical protein
MPGTRNHDIEDEIGLRPFKKSSKVGSDRDIGPELVAPPLSGAHIDVAEPDELNTILEARARKRLQPAIGHRSTTDKNGGKCQANPPLCGPRLQHLGHRKRFRKTGKP